MTQYITLSKAKAILSQQGVVVVSRTISDWIVRGSVGGRLIGNRWYVRQADIESLLSDQSPPQA
jgi:hypothetical protein